MSIDGDTVVVGAPYDGDKGGYSGSAYIFSSLSPLPPPPTVVTVLGNYYYESIKDPSVGDEIVHNLFVASSARDA